jgi:hypothetical protein
MSDQPDNNVDESTEATPQEKSGRDEYTPATVAVPRWVGIVFVVALFLVLCIIVLTLLGPALPTLFGVPNGGAE